MTDLEITRLCAEARRWHAGRLASKVVTFDVSPCAIIAGNDKGGESVYDPLHDDAQAMALLKLFNLDITNTWRDEPYGHWWNIRGTLSGWEKTRNENLNRAICECVAKMQAAKCA